MSREATELKFYIFWNGEAAAGIRPGFEEVTISFRYGHPIDEEVIECWRIDLKEFFDGARVLTQLEFDEECAANERLWP